MALDLAQGHAFAGSRRLRSMCCCDWESAWPPFLPHGRSLSHRHWHRGPTPELIREARCTSSFVTYRISTPPTRPRFPSPSAFPPDKARRLVERFEWHYTQRQLARYGGIRTHRSRVAMSRPPHPRLLRVQTQRPLVLVRIAAELTPKACASKARSLPTTFRPR